VRAAPRTEDAPYCFANSAIGVAEQSPTAYFGLASQSPLDRLLPEFRVTEDSVPLFDCDEGGFVQTKKIGKTRMRKVLCRSEAMEIMMRREAKKL
jgi:hypothetical protein